MARDAGPLLERWRQRHPEDIKAPDEQILRRVQEKYPGRFDDVSLTTRAHPFTLIDRATKAFQPFGEAMGRRVANIGNTAAFGLPEMALRGAEARGMAPTGVADALTQGPGAGSGQVIGTIFGGPRKAVELAGRGAGRFLRKTASHVGSSGVRQALTHPQSFLRGGVIGAAEGAALGASLPGGVQERTQRAALFAPTGSALGAAVNATRRLVGTRGLFRAGARRTRLQTLQQERLAGRYDRATQGNPEVARGLEESAESSLQRLHVKQQSLQRAIETESTGAARRLQEDVPAYLKAASEGYDRGIQEGFAKLRGAAPLTRKEVVAALEPVAKRFPDWTSQFMKRLPRKEVSARSLYTRLQRLSAKGHHTMQGAFVGDVKHALITAIEKKTGTDAFSRSQAFWREYSPFRDRLLKFAKPGRGAAYEQAGVAARIAKGAEGTGPSFVQEIEERLGVPLTDKLRRLYGQMTEAQQAQARVRLNKEGLLKQFRETREFLKQKSAPAAQQRLGRELFRRREAAAARQGVGRIAAQAGGYVLLYRMLGQIADSVGGGEGRGGQ